MAAAEATTVPWGDTPAGTGPAFGHPLSDVAVSLWVYAYPWVFLLGLVGNTLSLVVMLKGGSHGHSTRIYLGVLAVVDTLILLHYLLIQWLLQALDIHITQVYALLFTSFHHAFYLLFNFSI